MQAIELMGEYVVPEFRRPKKASAGASP